MTMIDDSHSWKFKLIELLLYIKRKVISSEGFAIIGSSFILILWIISHSTQSLIDGKDVITDEPFTKKVLIITRIADSGGESIHYYQKKMALIHFMHENLSCFPHKTMIISKFRDNIRRKDSGIIYGLTYNDIPTGFDWYVRHDSDDFIDCHRLRKDLIYQKKSFGYKDAIFWEPSVEHIFGTYKILNNHKVLTIGLSLNNDDLFQINKSHTETLVNELSGISVIYNRNKLSSRYKDHKLPSYDNIHQLVSNGFLMRVNAAYSTLTDLDSVSFVGRKIPDRNNGLKRLCKSNKVKCVNNFVTDVKKISGLLIRLQNVN